MTVDVSSSVQDQPAGVSHNDSTSANPPPPPPPPHRRPRVREVSSRFMSPVASHSSSSFSPIPNTKQRSSSVQKQRMEPLACADDNRIGFDCSSSSNRSPIRKHPQQHKRALFKENGGKNEQQQQPAAPPSLRSHRPDTPTVAVSSRLRLIQQRAGGSNISAATKLLQSSGLSSPAPPSNPISNSENSTKETSSTSLDDNHLIRTSSTRSSPDLRSSMPEADMLPVVSGRLLAERNVNRPNGISGDSSKFVASPCFRSLNLPRSTSDQSVFYSLKPAEKPPKQYNNSVKMGSLPLPPIPIQSKLVTDASKRARKGSSHQEDVHSLRMLHNHYLQWRFVNAKAEATMQSQRREAERTLYSLVVKMSELNEAVKRKRIELGLLRRAKLLSTTLDAQMPYLDEWFTLEEDYSESLSEAIQALLNASIQLPMNGNVRVDIRDIGEALNSAVKFMELIALNIQSFMPKAEEMDIWISELARVSGAEKALFEECGDLLFTTHKSQVEECSLRGQLIQLHQLQIESKVQ